MFCRKNKIICLFSLAVFLILANANIVFSSDENITVQMTVPAAAIVCGNGVVEAGEQCDAGAGNGVCPAACSAACTTNDCGGGGGGGGGGNNFPTISNVVVTPTQTTAKIVWQAADDGGIKAVLFEFGLTNAYGTSVVPVGNGNYEINLNGLVADTVYFYKISVTDTNDQKSTNTDSFKTLKEGEVPPVEEGQSPKISDVHIIPGINSAHILWNTDIMADSQVNYGLTAQYGGDAIDNGFVLQHDLSVLNLLPNKIYHYKIISTAQNGNVSSTKDAIFATLRDSVLPPDVSNLDLQTGDNQIILSWNNPNLAAVPDFAGVKILRKVGLKSNNINDGLLVYEGNGQIFTDNNVLPNVEYFYTIFSFDTSQNYSAGVFKSGKIIPLQGIEICNDNFDNDNNGLADCADPACVQFQGCQQLLLQEICNNGIDDDNNGLIDCADPVCVVDPQCNILPGANEICGNNIDDNANGLMDCADPACFGFAGCVQIVQEIQPPPLVSNVPEFARIKIQNLLFSTSNRKINLSLQGGKVVGLSGFTLTVGVPKNILAAVPKGLILRVDNRDAHVFMEVPAENRYYSDIVFPSGGNHFAVLEVDYGAGQMDQVLISINSLALGEVRGENNQRLSDSPISLFAESGQLWDSSGFGENNPQNTDINGLYGWMVPNGKYHLEIKKEGYFDRVTPNFNIGNNVINSSWQLIKIPTPLAEVIDPNVGVVENVKNVTQNISERAKVGSELALQNISDIQKNEAVAGVMNQVVVPTIVGLSFAAAAFNILDLLAWLRFLFLQPILLLGRRKREKWGLVYNALNKLPVDLAIVRLIDVNTGKIIQSRVTDVNGRYVFLTKPGKYRLTVQKTGMVFPSFLLKDVGSDGRRIDIYHGENIEVGEINSVLAVNIPLDPVGVELRTPRRIIWEKYGRLTQNILSWAGVIITIIALVLYPSWYLGVLLLIHLLLFISFHRLSKPKQHKGWGIVYDVESRRPIKRVIARLFDSQFNKLVDSQITDNNGKYGFLAGDNKYYTTYEHENYNLFKSEIIDLSNKEQEVVALDVGLKKKK